MKIIKPLTNYESKSRKKGTLLKILMLANEFCPPRNNYHKKEGRAIKTPAERQASDVSGLLFVRETMTILAISLSALVFALQRAEPQKRNEVC